MPGRPKTPTAPRGRRPEPMTGGRRSYDPAGAPSIQPRDALEQNDQSVGADQRPDSPARAIARALRRLPERLLHSLRRRHALAALQAAPSTAPLFICHGNICRSPYAAAALLHLLSADVAQHANIQSAGFIAPGRPSPPLAVEAAAARHVDLSNHRSRMIIPAYLEQADLVVVMDPRQAREIHHRFPWVHRPFLVLGDLDPLPIATRVILDPIDRPRADFDACYARIDRCLASLAQTMASPAPAHTMTSPPPHTSGE
jgi:protein-tyrosine-phosphatase